MCGLMSDEISTADKRSSLSRSVAYSNICLYSLTLGVELKHKGGQIINMVHLRR